MKLIIVESPGKIKKLNSILGNDYLVKASVGHIRDLDKKSLSYDETTFEATYEIMSDKQEVVKNLKSADCILVGWVNCVIVNFEK